MNVVIVEDEPLAAERLISLLNTTAESISVLEVFDSIKETTSFLETGKKIDLLFLDIELADGKSFEIFNKTKVDAPVIFTTAYDQYALQAFKHFSIDYLLKPIQLEQLLGAIKKYKRFENHNVNEQLQQLTSWVSNSREEVKERVLVKSGNKLFYKSTDEVAYFWAESKEVYIFTLKDNKKFLIDYTLEELEGKLDKKLFFRINRKAIINVNAIAEVKGLISTRLEVKLNQPCIHELAVSRDRSANFKSWLDH
jgi:DNA-binding LytR/AlgR family response regulator